MFIKLTAPATYLNEAGTFHYVNMSLVREIAPGTHRPYAKIGENTSMIQPPIDVSVLYFTDDEVTRVLETPEQIMDLLNGPQLHGAAL